MKKYIAKNTKSHKIKEKTNEISVKSLEKVGGGMSKTARNALIGSLSAIGALGSVAAISAGAYFVGKRNERKGYEHLRSDLNTSEFSTNLDDDESKALHPKSK